MIQLALVIAIGAHIYVSVKIAQPSVSYDHITDEFLIDNW